MTDRTPHQAANRTALIAGLLTVVIVATGLGAIAIAREKNVTTRAPAITGSIQFERRDVQSGRPISGELVFENRTTKDKVLIRGCKTDGLYGVGLRASDGYLQKPAFGLVSCSPTQSMIAKPGITVFRFKRPGTYIACAQSPQHQPPQNSKYWNPPCRKDARGVRDIAPPLPPGTYTAELFPWGQWQGPPVKPSDLIITSRK